jgi:hypothetical protein
VISETNLLFEGLVGETITIFAGKLFFVPDGRYKKEEK